MRLPWELFAALAAQGALQAWALRRGKKELDTARLGVYAPSRNEKEPTGGEDPANGEN